MSQAHPGQDEPSELRPPALETTFMGKRYSSGIDLGGLERHEAAIVYPRWARTVKNASLYIAPDADGTAQKVWWGDLASFHLHHLRGKGTYFVLDEWDSFWVHSGGIEQLSARGGAVDTHQPPASYVLSHAVAVVVNGRLRWTDAEPGAFVRRQQRNGLRRWRRAGGQRLTCGCVMAIELRAPHADQAVTADDLGKSPTPESR